MTHPFGTWQALVDLALAEDIGAGDITSLATVPAEATAEGTMLVKQPGVISGLTRMCRTCRSAPCVRRTWSTW